MISTKKININGSKVEGVAVKTNNDQILIIRSKNGILGCGYINVDVAAKFDDAIAIVTGVKSFDDMLKAKVVKTSKKAEELGVKQGMAGEDALAIMN
jgi:uncharacterized protein YunC (DUF1805 family)